MCCRFLNRIRATHEVLFQHLFCSVAFEQIMKGALFPPGRIGFRGFGVGSERIASGRRIKLKRCTRWNSYVVYRRCAVLNRLFAVLRLAAQPFPSAWLIHPQLAAGFNLRSYRVTSPVELRHPDRSHAASCRHEIVPTPPYDRSRFHAALIQILALLSDSFYVGIRSFSRHSQLVPRATFYNCYHAAFLPIRTCGLLWGGAVASGVS